MPEVRKLDSKRRAVFPTCFSPGDLFLEEEITDDRIVFRRLAPPEPPPLVEVERIDGLLMARATVDRETIRQAVRAERDAR